MGRIDTSGLTGYFKARYSPLVGKDWLRKLPDYEIAAFARVGFCCSGYGRSGGIARAASAKRDRRGRFVMIPKMSVYQWWAKSWLDSREMAGATVAASYDEARSRMRYNVKNAFLHDSFILLVQPMKSRRSTKKRGAGESVKP